MKPDHYRDDISAFAEAEYLLAATGVTIGLQAHQNRILRDVFTHDSEGRFPYQTVIYSAPKKSGKTEIGGLVALWMALTEGPYAEVYTPANDLEQSPSRVFRAAGRAIQANPRLSSVRVGKDVITFPDGTEIKTVSGDYGRGSPGKYNRKLGQRSGGYLTGVDDQKRQVSADDWTRRKAKPEAGAGHRCTAHRADHLLGSGGSRDR